MIIRLSWAGLLAAATSIAASSLAGAADRGQIRSFRDWIVGCDNTRTCRAFALPPIAEAGKTALRIDRGGGTDDALRVTVVLSQDVSVLPGASLQLVPRGGSAIVIALGRQATADDSDITVTDAALNRQILASLRSAEAFTVSLKPANGPVVPAGTVSLAGASAALLWMDERQNRIGTSTALARPVAEGAGAVPAPPAALPSPAPMKLTGDPPPSELPEPMLNAVLAAFRTLPQGSCDTSPEDASEGLSADRLAPGLLLVGLRCLAGAYNQADAFYIVTEGPEPTVRPASFPRMREPAPERERMRSETQPDNILWNSELSDETGTISHVAKGRGFADCGEMGSWRWDGRAFQPIELSIMPDCRGLLPPNWLTVYRTR